MALKLGLELFSLHCVQQELDKDPKMVLKKVLDIGFRHLEPANHSAAEEPGTGLGIPAEELGLGQSRELVLIQGIIDAWMEETDGLVLIDYKTDRVAPGQEEVLVKRYGVQLDYYKRALEQIVKKPV